MHPRAGCVKRARSRDGLEGTRSLRASAMRKSTGPASSLRVIRDRSRPTSWPACGQPVSETASVNPMASPDCDTSPIHAKRRSGVLTPAHRPPTCTPSQMAAIRTSTTARSSGNAAMIPRGSIPAPTSAKSTTYDAVATRASTKAGSSPGVRRAFAMVNPALMSVSTGAAWSSRASVTPEATTTSASATPWRDGTDRRAIAPAAPTAVPIASDTMSRRPSAATDPPTSATPPVIAPAATTAALTSSATTTSARSTISSVVRATGPRAPVSSSTAMVASGEWTTAAAAKSMPNAIDSFGAPPRSAGMAPRPR